MKDGSGHRACVAAVAVASMLAVSSCGEKKADVSDRADVLLEFGDSALTRSDVVARIPVGIAPDDSARLFRQIVENWVEDMLLTDMAEDRIGNLDRIERKVKAYRRQLIVAEYLRSVRDNGRNVADDDAVRSYFDAHRKEMLLEAPIVKGIYVKLPADAERLDDVRKWVRSASESSVDKLEHYGLGQALQYDYFENRWLDWQSLAEEIPYRFSDPDAFLSTLVAPDSDKDSGASTPAQGPARGFFETQAGGSVYMLHVSRWIPSGSEMPYEFASPRIASMIEQQNAAEYQKALVASLYRRAKKEKVLRIVNYDPGIDKKK